MKSKFLVNLKNDEKGKWIATCASAKIQVTSNSKEDALAEIKKEFRQFLKYAASRYLSELKGNPNIVNCPEGKILLPADIWKCKLTGEKCPTQAQVFLNQEDEFRVKCSANEMKKDQILNLIRENKYDGFHHVHGRLKCSLCRGKEYLRYHYPWELNSLYQYIDIVDNDFRTMFLRSGIDLNAYSNGLCPECFVDIISKLNINAIGTFERIDLDFYR
jgi:hypothetical protein